jgi:ribosome-associated toxin RatA of RatAB toxin-antitoxin module
MVRATLRQLWLLASLAMLMPLAAAQGASDLDVQAERKGDLIEVLAQAIVHAPPAIVWATLTDYERLPEFIPGIDTSRVLERDGHRITVAQTGQARFMFLSLPIVVTLESTEYPPHVVEVRRIAGTLRHLQGRYEVTPLSGNRVLLRWRGSLSHELDLPPLIGTTLTRLSIKDQFAGMVREIERRAGRRPAVGEPERRLAR